MRKDTNKLCIGICGHLPGAVELMESRDDVEYTTFSNGSELCGCLEDAAPFDCMVIQSEAGVGMVPLYYPGCDGDCFVYLTGDPQTEDEKETLNEMIDTQLNEKWWRLSPTSARVDREDILVYKLKKGVEAVKQDGVPGLRLGERERYAKDTLQAWLIGLLLEKPWSGGELAHRLAAEKMSEVENTLAEEWTEPGDIDGWEILRIIKGSGAKVKGSPDVYVTKLVLHTFHNDFHAFLYRETPPFTLARETA